MSAEDQEALKELLRNSVDGSDDDVEEAVRIVFEGDDEDFDQAKGNWLEPLRDSLRSVLVATEFIVFE